MQNVRVNDKIEFDGCKRFLESLYHFSLCGGRVLEHVSDSTFSVSSKNKAKNAFASLIKLIAVVVLSILTLAIPFIIRQANRSGVKILAQPGPPTPPVSPRQPGGPNVPGKGGEQTDLPLSPGLEDVVDLQSAAEKEEYQKSLAKATYFVVSDSEVRITWGSGEQRVVSAEMIETIKSQEQHGKSITPAFVDKIGPFFAEVRRCKSAYSVLPIGVGRLKAKALIAYMKESVAWAKTEEGRRELDLCYYSQLSEANTCSNILPNLFIGGETCLAGVINHGATQRNERWGHAPPKPVATAITKQHQLYNFHIRPSEDDHPEGAQLFDDIEAFKKQSLSFTPHATYVGGGKFGYVYSTNGNGIKKSRAEAMDAAGGLSCTAKVFLHPAHQQVVTIEDNPRHIEAELKFNFDGNLTNDTDYFNVLAQIDSAVNILNAEESKGEVAEPMIVHCSSGKERSVTTGITIILRNLQRQGVELNQELIDLTIGFVQARRASATDFADKIEEFREGEMSFNEYEILQTFHQAGLPFTSVILSHASSFDQSLRGLIISNTTPITDSSIQDIVSVFIAYFTSQIDVDEERLNAVLVKYVKKRLTLTPEVVAQNNGKVKVTISRQQTWHPMEKNPRGVWLRGNSSPQLECRPIGHTYRSVDLMFSYVMRLLKKNPKPVSKPEDLIHPMRDRFGPTG